MAKEDVKLLISADGQKAIKEISEVTQHFGKFGNSISGFLQQASGFVTWQTAAVAGIGAITAGLAVAIKKQIDYADQMANMSKRTGLAVESLSKLAYVAQQSDTSAEALQKSMKFLNVALFDVSAGSKTALEKFSQFGIEVRNADGTVKSAEETLMAAAAAYVKLDSDAARTSMAIELFGKAGQDLMPMLSEGADGIKALTDEAKDLGLEINSKTAAAAERFNDNLDKLASFGKGAVNVLVEELAPALDGFSNAIDNSNTSVDNWTEKLRSALSTLIDIAKYTTPGLGIGNPVMKYTTKPGLFGDVKVVLTDAEMEKLAKDNEALMKSQEDVANSFGVIYAPKGAIIPTDKGKGGKQSSGNSGGTKGFSGGTLKKEEDFFLRLRPRATADSGFGLADQWITDLTSAAYGDPEKIKIGFANQSSTLSPLEMVDVPALDPNLLRDRQQPLIDQWAKYYEELQEMGTTNFLIMNETTQQLFGGMGDAMEGLGNLLSSMAGKTQQDYQAMFEIGKAFKSAEIVTSTYSAAVKAYDSQIGIPVVGPALAVAAAASAIAFGTAQLANLWATQPGQSSIGGASAAPTPSFASRNPQGGSGGGSSRNITIKFEGFIWDKDRLAREIVPAIDRALADGIRR